MKSIINTTVIGLSLHLAMSAHAGGREGHGGDAVVCYNRSLIHVIDSQGRRTGEVKVPAGAKITSVELLDYWDWSQRSPFKIDLGSERLSVTSKAAKALERYRNVDAATAEKITSYLPLTKPVPVSRGSLPEIGDSFEYINMKPNCAKRQLAVQNPKVTFGEARVKVDAALYALLPKDHQAGILLHEAIYGFFLDQKIVNGRSSEDVAYLNFMIATGHLTSGNYSKFLAEGWRESFGITASLALGFREKELSKYGFVPGDLVIRSSNFWEDLTSFESVGGYEVNALELATSRPLRIENALTKVALSQGAGVLLYTDQALVGTLPLAGFRLGGDSLIETSLEFGRGVKKLMTRSGEFQARVHWTDRSQNLLGATCEGSCEATFDKALKDLSDTTYEVRGDRVIIDADPGFAGGQNTTVFKMSGTGSFRATEIHDVTRMTYVRGFRYTGTIQVQMSYPVNQTPQSELERLSHSLHEMKVACLPEGGVSSKCVFNFLDGRRIELNPMRTITFFYSAQEDRLVELSYESSL